MRQIFLAFSILGLAACDATGQLGAEGSPVWQMRTMNPQARLEYFEQKCLTYGYVAGTDAMRDCIADENRNWRD